MTKKTRKDREVERYTHDMLRHHWPDQSPDGLRDFEAWYTIVRDYARWCKGAKAPPSAEATEAARWLMRRHASTR